MFSTLFVAAVAASTAGPSETASAELVRLAAGPCWQIESGAISVAPPTDLATRDTMLKGFGLQPGIAGKAYERLGDGAGLVNRATMASRDFGGDSLILAFGGQAPGCSVMLLSASGESREYEIVAALAAKGWREPRPGMAMQRGFVGKRMLVRRDHAGKPYLANVLTIMKPGSDWRHAVTVVTIPPHVTLPEGF